MRALNLAIPIAYLVGVCLGMPCYLIAAESLQSIGVARKTAEGMAGWIALALIVLLAIGLARSKVNQLGAPTEETATGHTLLAFGNIAAILTTVVPTTVSFVKGDPNVMFYLWLFIPVLLFNLFIWPMGWKRATSHAGANDA